MQEVTITTESKIDVVNVTERLARYASEVTAGLALYSLPHTTAALLVTEDDDELRQDLATVAENWLAEFRPFRHFKNNNPNADAHILSAFAGTSVVVAIEDGELDLGRYQNLLLLEMDGPKERRIRVKIQEDVQAGQP